MDYTEIENILISEINLTPIQSKLFLLIVTKGKMNAEQISKKLDITLADALIEAKKLIDLGAFIELSETEFETMHPRFTAVNMYRKICEKQNKKFGRNKMVDNIGVVLERPYDDVRTKYPKN